MKTGFDCLPCFLLQSLDTARMLGCDEFSTEKLVRDVLEASSRMDLAAPPPVMGQYIHRRIREVSGNSDPYKEIKDRFNRMALNVYPDLAERARGAKDPLEASVRLAITGNLIDFGTASGVSEEEVLQAVDEALAAPLKGQVRELEEAISRAGYILYIFDNCGEIVLDRILLERLPLERVVGAVKPSPIINDATMREAKDCGITEMIPVLDTGSDAPGAVLRDCSQEFLEHYHRADLVLAKGQGNFEALSQEDKEIFFLLKAKCSVVASHLGCPQGSMVLRCSAHVS